MRRTHHKDFAEFKSLNLEKLWKMDCNDFSFSIFEEAELG